MPAVQLATRQPSSPNEVLAAALAQVAQLLAVSADSPVVGRGEPAMRAQEARRHLREWTAVDLLEVARQHVDVEADLAADATVVGVRPLVCREVGAELRAHPLVGEAIEVGAHDSAHDFRGRPRLATSAKGRPQVAQTRSTGVPVG